MCEKFPSKLTNQTRIPLRFFPQYIIRHKILKLETNVSPSSIISIFESRKTKFLSQRFNYSPNFKCNFAYRNESRDSYSLCFVYKHQRVEFIIRWMDRGSESLANYIGSQMLCPLACSFNELSTLKQDIVSQVSPSLPRSLRFDRWLLHRADRRHRLQPSLYRCAVYEVHASIAYIRVCQARD